jgi:hypothetical protein
LFIQEGDVQMEETEDEQIARAIQMSMEGGSVRNKHKYKKIIFIVCFIYQILKLFLGNA